MSLLCLQLTVIPTERPDLVPLSDSLTIKQADPLNTNLPPLFTYALIQKGEKTLKDLGSNPTLLLDSWVTLGELSQLS